MRPNIRPKAALASLIVLFALCFTGVAIFESGCTTSQQTTALNTLGSLEATATTAVDNYDALVIKGVVSTNSFPQVQKAYNDLQKAIILAATLTQNGTNAFASTAIVQETTDLLNLINTAK